MVGERRYGRISLIGYRVTSVTSHLWRGGRTQAAGKRGRKVSAHERSAHDIGDPGFHERIEADIEW
jgi:hypothetical protein